jgi:hypothetical protein
MFHAEHSAVYSITQKRHWLQFAYSFLFFRKQLLCPAEGISDECSTWNTDRLLSGWIGKSQAR